MKLSILIVNWNTKEMVTRCVASVLEHAPSFDFEVIVVDNASEDGSVQALRQRFGSDGRVKIISAEKNLGFAKGNNLALEQASGEYVFLLNSDTEVKNGSIDKLVEYMDKNSKVGVAGPKLLNSDGSVQPSVRRFPTLWDQVRVFSGLFMIFRPKKYLMDDFDYSKEQEVDQVMGAALMTRREITDRLGLFDEEFYLWYEEVDFCYQVKKEGWKIKYNPEAEIIHYGGESFSQLQVHKRKKILSRSMLHYFRKNKPVWQSIVLQFIIPPVLWLTWIMNKIRYKRSLKGWYTDQAQKTKPKTQKQLFLVLLAFFVVEAVSLLAFRFEALSLPLLVLIGLLIFALSLYRLEWGVYLLFAELFIGSRGRLLEHDIISLRMIVFGAVVLAFGLKILNSKLEILYKYKILNPKFKILYGILLLVIGWGIVWGYVNGNGLMNVFQDANAYLYLLAFPVVLTAISSREQVNKIFALLGAGIILIALKTLLLFVWFTYDFAGVTFLYNWVIQNDIGEITGITGGAPRIFMQSQFWALAGVFIWGVQYLQKKMSFGEWLILSAAILSLILSLSRSFWLGGFFAGIFTAGMLYWYFKAGFVKVLKWAMVLVVIAMVQVGLLFVITSFSGDRGVTGAVSSRIGDPTTEAAGGARLLLLPELLDGIREAPVLGEGFGEVVGYDSYLPDRITEENPTGKIDNYAFEWGYLDIMLKIGMLGFVVYLLFVANIFKQGFNNFQFSIFNFQTLGVLAGLVALVTLHVTTPYLNHPLGIGYLILSYISFKEYGK